VNITRWLWWPLPSFVIACTLTALVVGVAFSHRDLAAGDSADSQTRAVEVSGAGVDVDSAKKDACREAVRQVVGAYVNSETRTENDELIEDKVISLSSGLVEKMETLKESKDDGLVRVRISATVRITKVLDSLKANNIAIAAVDGESLGAKLLTSRDQRKAEAELIGTALDGCPVKWFNASVIGEPKLGEKIDGRNVPVFVTVKVEPNIEAFIAVADKLDKALQATNSKGGEFQCDAASIAAKFDGRRSGDVELRAPSCLKFGTAFRPLYGLTRARNSKIVTFPVKFLAGGQRSTWKHYEITHEDAAKHFGSLWDKTLSWRLTLLDKASQEIAIKTGRVGGESNLNQSVSLIGIGYADQWGHIVALAPAYFCGRGDNGNMVPTFTFEVGCDLGVEEVKTISSVTVSLQ